MPQIDIAYDLEVRPFGLGFIADSRGAQINVKDADFYQARVTFEVKFPEMQMPGPEDGSDMRHRQLVLQVWERDGKEPVFERVLIDGYWDKEAGEFYHVVLEAADAS